MFPKNVINSGIGVKVVRLSKLYFGCLSGNCPAGDWRTAPCSGCIRIDTTDRGLTVKRKIRVPSIRKGGRA